MLPESVWTCAVDAAGKPRPVDETGLPVAQVAELTGLLPGLTEAGWPDRMRVLVRRERPHPGATISVFEAHDGWRYQCLATDTPRTAAVPGSPAPRPRPRRGPGQSDQADRHRPLPVPRVRHQPGLAAAGVDCGGSDRLDPDHPPRRCPGRRRTEEAALPTPPHRRPDRPRPTQDPDQDRHQLALGRADCRCVRPTQPDPTTATRLTGHAHRRPPPEEPGVPDTRPADQPAHTHKINIQPSLDHKPLSFRCLPKDGG